VHSKYVIPTHIHPRRGRRFRRGEMEARLRASFCSVASGAAANDPESSRACGAGIYEVETTRRKIKATFKWLPSHHAEEPGLLRGLGVQRGIRRRLASRLFGDIRTTKGWRICGRREWVQAGIIPGMLRLTVSTKSKTTDRESIRALMRRLPTSPSVPSAMRKSNLRKTIF